MPPIPAELLQRLPPYLVNEDIIIHDSQQTNDIIAEVLTAHSIFSTHYDFIAGCFLDHRFSRVPEQLFDFCKKFLPYKAEPAKRQTTRSPAAVLELADQGSDCKHTAGFIAGVLDAMNRTGYHSYRWAYRFVSYRKNERPYHVFVICNGQWIDPTPIEHGDAVTERFYNDRKAIPVYSIDKKPTAMLSRLSGVDYIVKENALAFTEPRCTGNIGELLPQSPYTATAVPSTITSKATGLSSTVGDVTGYVGAVQSTGATLANFLPEGGLKDFLTSFFSDPSQALLTLFTGRTYPSGWYALGERYMRNILGMDEIQRRTQVPDEYVPQAGIFWSAALGVRIQSDDHLEKLSLSPQAYIDQVKQFGYEKGVPLANIERASRILKAMNYYNYYFLGAGRNEAIPLEKFNIEPFLVPIPSAAVNDLFTGVNPINGVEYRQGYPVPGSVPVAPGQPIPGLPGTGGGIPLWIWLAGGGLLAFLLLRRKR